MQSSAQQEELSAKRQDVIEKIIQAAKRVYAYALKGNKEFFLHVDATHKLWCKSTGVYLVKQGALVLSSNNPALNASGCLHRYYTVLQRLEDMIKTAANEEKAQKLYAENLKLRANVLQRRFFAKGMQIVKTHKDNSAKLKCVLQTLREKNTELKKLTAANLISIFTDANTARYYTNGEPKLPVDIYDKTLNTDKAKLMRKFSVEFQKECQKQSLIFSNTNKSGNSNGMRTKSVVDFAKQNNIKLNDICQAIWR